MTREYVLPVEVEPLEDSEGYLAICPILPGCHAEGRTYAEALENLRDVARAHIEIRLEKGLPLPPELQEVSTGRPLVIKGQIPVSVKA